MWCVKWLWWFRDWLQVAEGTGAGSGCGGGPGKEGLTQGVSPGLVYTGSRPGRRSRRREAKTDRNMACLRRLLPPCETCSPLMEAPVLVVTGTRPA